MEGYYQEMLNVIKKYKNYSVLGHLDLMTRYDEIGNYPFEKVKPIITKILKIVIQDGKGIGFKMVKVLKSIPQVIVMV